ncbi:MAG: hypothetical protein IJQ80_06585 [Clostridia bacterium]|nr:hypothetical protein [Clostridia bacterium]
MKKIVSLILISVLVLSCAALSSCGSNSSVPKGMKAASPDDAPFVFYVPEAWKSDVSSGTSSAYYSDADTSAVGVMTFSRDGDQDIKSWWDGYLEDFTTVYSDFELESCEEAALGDREALKFVFKGTQGGTNYKFMQVIATGGAHDDTFVVLTYVSSPDVFDKHTDDVQKMIDNFRFKDDASSGERDLTSKGDVVSQDFVSYKLTAPEGWERVVSASSTVLRAPDGTSSFSVMSFSLEHSGVTLDDWWDIFKEDFSGTYSNVRFDEGGELYLDGTSAVRHTFSGDITAGGESASYRFLQIAAIRKRKLSSPEVFVLTYTATADDYDANLDDVEYMISNFVFK